MTIQLQDLWPIKNPREYKIHFARHNGDKHPLDVWARDKNEWVGWQEYWPGRNEFNRPYIFSLMQFYHETDTWLFGGVFRVLQRFDDRYEVELTEKGSAFIGRLKLYTPYRSRTPRPTMERQYADFEVQQILREPYAGEPFPGYAHIDLSFGELETIVRNERSDWRAALENVKGVYLIMDKQGERVYVGAAYGEEGVWSRWVDYVGSGHGGNKELRELVATDGIDYCRRNFRFALLEQLLDTTPDDVVLGRESYWKDILRSRGRRGLNRN